MNANMKLGIDIGSVTAKAVVLDERDTLVFSRYTRTKGRTIETILDILEELLAEYPVEGFSLSAVTGSGGRLLSEILGIPFVNEIIAQAAGTAKYHPDVKTILEIGGEDS